MKDEALHEPDMFRRQREGIVLSRVEQFGIDDTLAAPVAHYYAPQGFDERKWVAGTTDTVIAWTIAGADVLCQWGKLKGKWSYAAQLPITLIPRGAPNHNIASGSIHFGYLILPDILLSHAAAELRSPVRHADALRDDLMGFRDDVLRHHLQSYLASAVASSSRLQMEARSLLIAERLLTFHHGADQAGELRRPRGLALWQLRRTCDAMEAKLAADISLYELAQIAGLSPTHFSRAFKQSLGVSPFNWLRARRIEAAKRLLADRRMPLAEIAIAVGFSAQSEFTTAFRRATGLPPGIWRRDKL